MKPQQHNHIITRVVWNSTSDIQEYVHEIQNKISHLNSFVLPGIFHDCLDEFCPENKTLRLKQLELDLGSISYDEFNSKIPELIRNVLKVKLSELFLLHGADALFDTEHDSTNDLESLNLYLSSGNLPIWHNLKYSTLEDLLENILSENTKGLSELLRDIGKSHAVRKRIVWQFKKSLVFKIMKVLEPNNYEYIENYAEELIRIQSSKSIPNTGSTEFSQNILLWILDHLLVDRGTLFNKVAFIESNLHNVANHYNVNYYHLLDLLISAQSISTSISFQKDFFYAIQVLATKQKGTGIRLDSVNQNQQYLNKAAEIKLIKQRYKLSGLFNGPPDNLFSRTNHEIKIILTNLKAENKTWTKFLECLNNPLFHQFISALQPEFSKQFLDQLTRIFELLKNRSGLTKNKLYDIVMSFLLSGSFNNLKPDQIQFSLLSVIQQKLNIPKNSWISVLIKSSIPPGIKGTNPSLLQSINGFAPHFNNSETLLFLDYKSKALSHLLSQKRFDKIANRSVVFQIQTVLLSNPEILKVWFFRNKSSKSQTHFNYILNSEFTEAYLILNSSTLSEFTTIARQKLFELRNDTEFSNISKTLLANLDRWIAELILEDKKRSPQELFRNFIKYFSVNLFEYSYIFLNSFFVELNLRLSKSPFYHEEFKNNWLLTNFIKLHGNQINDLVQALSEPKLGIRQACSMLNQIILNDFNTILSISQEEKWLLMEYFIPGVSHYRNKIEQLNEQLLSQGIVQHYQLIFWQCVGDITSHEGKTQPFFLLYKNALALHINPEYPINSHSLNPLSHFETIINTESDIKDTNNSSFANHLKLTDWLKSTELKEFATNNPGLFNQSYFDLNPAVLYALVRNTEATLSNINLLESIYKYDKFNYMLLSQIADPSYQLFQNLRKLFLLGNHLHLESALRSSFEMIIWERSFEVIQNITTRSSSLSGLVEYLFEKLPGAKEDKFEAIRNGIKDAQLSYPFSSDPLFLFIESFMESGNVKKQEKEFNDGAYNNCTPEIARTVLLEFLTEGRVPLWFNGNNVNKPNNGLRELLNQYPKIVIDLLNSDTTVKSKSGFQLSLVDYSLLLNTFQSLKFVEPQTARDLNKLYVSLVDKCDSSKIVKEHLHQFLILTTIEIWENDNWEHLQGSTFWKRLIRQLVSKGHHSVTQVVNELNIVCQFFPPVFIKSFTEYKAMQMEKEITKSESKIALKSPNKLIQIKPGEQIAINNAGLVLLNNYFIGLFQKLGLTDTNMFKDSNEQQAAVHYLQYLVTGDYQTEEIHLSLNKILSGLHLSEPISFGISINDKAKKILDSLLNAVLDHWKSSGSHSIGGFRGNWLARNGVLLEDDYRWELTVEKKVYDLLLNKSPFSFSIIKMPWMQKPLHVNWSY